MDEERVTIQLRPDLTIYLIVAYVAAVTAFMTVGALHPTCRHGTRPCTLVEAVVTSAAYVLVGVVVSLILLRRQVLILDPDGIRRRTGRREKLVRWTELSLIAELGKAGGRYPPAIVIEHGIGRLFYIYASFRIGGKALFRTIDHYVTAHSIKVPTRAA